MSELDADAAAERSFQQRFGALIDLVGGPTKAGKITGVARQTVDQWRKEGRRIPLTAAHDLARAVGKSLDWLMTGDDVVIGDMQVQSFGAPVPEGFVTLPVFRVEAGAGGGRYPVQPEMTDIATDTVAFRELWLRSLGLNPAKAHVLWAVGDSMAPTIRSGDMLIVDRMIDRVQDDGIYVVVVGGGVMVKRVQLRHNGSVALKSDNPRYDEQIVPADEVPSLIVEGRVLWAGGPI